MLEDTLNITITLNNFRNRKLKSRKFRSKLCTHMKICEISDISNYKNQLSATTIYQIHATQRSRDKRLTEGRTRPKTDPTYCICSSGVNSYKVALKIVMFKLIFQYFMQNTQHWSWYLRVCTLQQIHATQRSWDKLLM